MKKPLLVPFLAIIIMAVIYTFTVVNREQAIEVQGQIEFRQIKISSKIVGRIDSLPVKKGTIVSMGDLLYKISSPEIDAKLIQAQSANLAATYQENKALNGAQAEDILAAETNYKKATAAAELWTNTYKRVENLFKEGIVAKQKKEEAYTKMVAAIETQKGAEQIYKKAKKGARKEDKAAAKAMVSRTEAIIQEVNAYKSEASMTSPIDGEVTNIIIEKGELAPAGFPVITIADPTDNWATFNVVEKYLVNFKIGSEFKASIPALGLKDVPFKVTYSSVMGSFATHMATKNLGDFDMKTFEIEAKPLKEIKDLRAGMSLLINMSQF